MLANTSHKRHRIPAPSPLSIALSLLLAAPGAWAADTTPVVVQAPPTSTSAHVDAAITTFDTIVVTSVAPSQAMTFITDTKLPRQPVPASDGADYLKTIPGFSTVRSGGTNGDPVLRGMFGSRLNLLTSDGHMYGACPSRMDNAMSYVSPETYDRLIVTKGPQTVLWGPGASAGTVRFERDIPFFDKPGAQFAGSALVGSFDRNDQVVDTAVGNADAYARLTANRSESGDYEDGDGNRVPSAWNKWNADASFGWTPDADTLVEVSAGGGDGRARYAARSMDGSQFERESYGLRFERKNMGDVFDSIQASAYYNAVDHVMDNYSLRDPDPTSSMPMPMASNVAHRTYGGRAVLGWDTDRWDLKAGVDTRDSRHDKRSGMGRDTYKNQPWTTDARFGNDGVFAELGWRLDERYKLVGGARVDRATVTDERRTIGSMMMSRPNPTAGQTRRETLPSGFARLEAEAPDSPLSWYAGIGHVERMPDYWELFSPTLGPVGSVNAFAGIEPERTTQIDAGIHYRGTRWDAWASAYIGRIDDYILFDYPAKGMSGTRARNTDARIHGTELGVEYRLRDHWKLGGTLAYAWGELDEGGALPQMPPLEARLSASYDNTRWSLGGLLRVAAAQDRVNPGHGNVVGQDLGPSSGFAVFSINGGYRFSPHVQLAAGIDNVFDRAYSEHLNLAGNSAFGYPAAPTPINEPGRSLWAKVNVKF